MLQSVVTAFKTEEVFDELCSTSIIKAPGKRHECLNEVLLVGRCKQEWDHQNVSVGIWVIVVRKASAGWE